jgi:peroxiredoxin family protein
MEEIAMPTAVMHKQAEQSQAEKEETLSIIMFSGTADKFIPLGVLAQAAAAMGTQVNVFVTGFALQGFTKKPAELPFPVEFAAMAPALVKGMQATHVPSWDKMLRQAKDLGAKVYTCSMMSGVMGLKKEDFNDLVDDVVGAATFLQKGEHGQTLFI